MKNGNVKKVKTVKALVKKHGFEILKWEKPEPQCYGTYRIDTHNNEISSSPLYGNGGIIEIWYSLDNQCKFWYRGEKKTFGGFTLYDMIEVLDEFFDEIKKVEEGLPFEQEFPIPPTSEMTDVSSQRESRYQKEYKLDIPDDMMINNQQFVSAAKGYSFKVNDDNNTLIIDFKGYSKASEVKGKTVVVTGRLLPKAKSLIKKVDYQKDVEIIQLTMSLKHFYKYYKDGIVNLNPAYQRDFVWTLDQKRAYIQNIFENRAKIEPTIVEYYNDEDDLVMEVLDGKQRLNALFGYLENEFSVSGLKFKQLCQDDQTFLVLQSVRYHRVMNRGNSNDVSNDVKLRLFYEINLLGTRMTDKELQQAKAMLDSEEE